MGLLDKKCKAHKYHKQKSLLLLVWFFCLGFQRSLSNFGFGYEILLCVKQRSRATSLCVMGTEEPKDFLKGVDWKSVGGDVSNQSTSTTSPVIKKRLPKKIRQVPEYYFLPRRSLPSAMAVYGSIIAAGVGAGMLVEIWINKKIAEDGGVIWELDK